jgi:hypothetical protein
MNNDARWTVLRRIAEQTLAYCPLTLTEFGRSRDEYIDGLIKDWRYACREAGIDVTAHETRIIRAQEFDERV